MEPENVILDWGSDMAGFLAWRREHPLEETATPISPGRDRGMFGADPYGGKVR